MCLESAFLMLLDGGYQCLKQSLQKLSMCAHTQTIPLHIASHVMAYYIRANGKPGCCAGGSRQNMHIRLCILLCYSIVVPKLFLRGLPIGPKVYFRNISPKSKRQTLFANIAIMSVNEVNTCISHSISEFC